MRSQIRFPLLKMPNDSRALAVERQRRSEPHKENDETLIVDDRAHIRPAQMVENKLKSILKDAFVPISHAQLTSVILRRSLS